MLLTPLITRAMSRKKTLKGIGISKSPKGSPGGGRTGKGLTAGASPTSGLVYPSGPSINGSGEFYDIAFKNKVMNLDALKVKLQIWDTAGQERFRSVTHAYYRDAHALLLLYDVTNKASFDNIRAWLTEIHEYAQQDVVIMLLGNKADFTHDRVVKREEGEKLAKEFGVPFMETSARSGMNVELAFTAVAKELKHRTMKEPDEPKFQLQEYVNKEMRTSGCCRS
ncbi:ras-related protein Rab-26 isoform X3 [Nerophis lumbriciformis]|uniref:ras-related protein Rab-26 isoform X3 n=1 Tax=Nerophis lumbriciformis TaxID=546530 RepID=UPI002ADF80B2|nr:ras-related protein Rab-26-like isoform X4 [Nerophis lumbriciformis]